jgi:serine phosphatase RsbU (regulator of sigma subunit)/Flp pilus assembly protein TadD
VHKLRFIFLWFFILSGYLAFSQQHEIDSVMHSLQNVKEDTSRIKTVDKFCKKLNFRGKYDKADSLAHIELAMAQRINYKEGVVASLCTMGESAVDKGEYAKANDLFTKALEVSKDISDKKWEASAYNLLGSVYEVQGNYSKAIELYYNALRIDEALKNPDGIAGSYNNLGRIYDDSHNSQQALESYNKALDLYTSLKDTLKVATVLNNIAIIYDEQQKFSEAMQEFIKALNIYRKLGQKQGEAMAINNIGSIYYYTNKTDTAIAQFNQALKIYTELGNKQGMAMTLGNLADIVGSRGEFDKALDYINKDVVLAKEAGSLNDIEEAELLFYNAYAAKGEEMKALEHYKTYIALRDSVYNKENTKKIIQSEMNYDFEKKQAAEKAEQDKKDAIQKEQAFKQQLIIYFISGILLLVFGFAIFAYRSYLQKQKANMQLDEKNRKIEGAYTIIEEKNREITDSINYAKRIQNAMLPTKELIQSAFPQNFVLFKPKAIVSGDFYFMSKQNGTTFLAAADCTGHGVPGAFMSMIGNEKLNDAVEQSKNTGEILKLLNRGIKTSLRQSSEADSTRDGMDIALIALSYKSSANSCEAQFSGANRPLWLVRKGKTETEEIKATKQAIGGFTGDDETFEIQNVTLNEGDTFYLFSDGFADQFGGKDGKKLTTKKFRELIVSIQNKSMPEQGKKLDAFIESWKGSKEQLDDILIIGVRV